MSFGSKDVRVAFRGFGDGVNSSDPPITVGKNYLSGTSRMQCVASMDAILNESSIFRRPGTKAIQTNLIGPGSGKINGLGSYLQHDGADTLIKVAGGRVFEVAKEPPYGDTFLADMGGAGSVARFAVYKNRMFICNGHSNLKLEGSTAYGLGLTAPVGLSVEAVTGGSLPDGVYQIYACYARKVLDVVRLYSTGFNLGIVTLGSGLNTVSIGGWQDSDDPQSNCKALFMSDAGGSTYYLYGVMDNGDEGFEISSGGSRNVAITYGAVAVNNIQPVPFKYILALDNRIFGATGQYLYYSLQSGTEYDLDRWTQLGYIEYPFEITGLFALAGHLYINTPAGIIQQPYGDVSARFVHVEKRFNFRFIDTIVEWAGRIIGVTNDGMRSFDGMAMSDYELTRDIKPEIGILYNGASNDHPPCATMIRRDDRTEYHLFYRDLSVSAGYNNRRAVLNLDKFLVVSTTEVVAPWEIWSVSADAVSVDSDGTAWYAQSGVGGDNVLYIERSDRVIDEGVYKGVTRGTSIPEMLVQSGVYIIDLAGRVQWRQIRALAQLAAEMVIEVHLLAYPSVGVSKTIEPVTTEISQFGVARFGVDRFAPGTPAHRKVLLPRTMRGYAFYIVLRQSAEDKNFNLLQLEIEGILSQTRFT